MADTKILIIGEKLRHRTFNGANKALPVLASSLEHAEFHRVVQYDLERPDLSVAGLIREATDADLVAFAGCLTTQWPDIDEHARLLRHHLNAHGRGEVPIMVGGYATKGVEDVARLTPWIDAYFNGEGEEAIVTIARAVARGSFRCDMASIPGLCFLDSEGRFHLSLAPRVRNLDAYDQGYCLVHVPAVHDMDIFCDHTGRQLRTAQLYTQRGCPWVCGYCNKSSESATVSRLGIESLRHQLRQLKAAGFEAIYLDVDTFTVNPTLAKEEARCLHDEGFVWGSNTRIDRIDRALMEFFRAHGCVYMFFGVEHTLPEVALAIQKFNGPLMRQLEQSQTYTRRVEQVFAEMRHVRLPSSYFIILGLPRAVLGPDRSAIVGYRATTFEEDVGAIRFGLERCRPNYLNLNILRFMPGSVAADVPDHPAFGTVRPSGGRPITAGYFLPRVSATLGYPASQPHGAFRLCESVDATQPISTAVDAQRAYDTFSRSVEMINAGIDAGASPVTLFVDHQILENNLVRRSASGRYSIAPFKEFEAL